VADLALLDNGIVAMSDSDIHEKLAYIHPTARDFVDEIFTFSGAKKATGDHYFTEVMVGRRRFAILVGEHE
jgi:hypothetical protein